MVNSGFSILELLLALAITFLIALTGFQLFQQNEKIFQDQNQNSETQQNLRAVVFQINDEVRRAGQGVPFYAASYDAAPGEPVAVVLAGSDSSHLRIREGYSGVATTALSNPADYQVGTSRSIMVADASPFSNTLGTNSPHGRFAYIWGSGDHSCWSWVRTELVTVDSASATLTLIPRQMGDNCRAEADVVHFTAPQAVDLEEAASIYFSAGSIWRTTATDMIDSSAPAWSAASELGRNFAQLTFTYYDSTDTIVLPQSLSARVSIVRIDVTAQAQNGSSLRMRGYPRNTRVR